MGQKDWRLTIGGLHAPQARDRRYHHAGHQLHGCDIVMIEGVGCS
jgi:hypothetical protein